MVQHADGFVRRGGGGAGVCGVQRPVFIRTIVRPLGQVEATANRIAHGDLTTRLPGAPYDDEIGRLCKAINQMAEDLTKRNG